jgi:hypothetical protein
MLRFTYGLGALPNAVPAPIELPALAQTTQPDNSFRRLHKGLYPKVEKVAGATGRATVGFGGRIA